MAMTWHPCLSGTSIYWIPTETAGSRPLNAWAISLCVLSVTSCPRILRDFGATPNTSQPPAPLRNAHAVCIPSFNSPVVFFNSKCTFSSLAISLSSSSMFIVPYFFFIFSRRKASYCLTISFLMSIFNRSVIFSTVAKSGCDEFVHHFDTVEGFTPNSSANHLLVFFFSTSINFKRFMSSVTRNICTKIMNLFHLQRKTA